MSTAIIVTIVVLFFIVMGLLGLVVGRYLVKNRPNKPSEGISFVQFGLGCLALFVVVMFFAILMVTVSEVLMKLLSRVM